MIETQRTPGRLVLSFDLELAWGSIENGAWQRLEADGVFAHTREVVAQLLATMRSLEIPALWAVVGALWEKPGEYRWDHIPAKMRDPIVEATRAARRESLDGRDLLGQIAAEPVSHLLGCHTYAHVRYGHPAVTAELVREDLLAFHETRPAMGTWSPVLVFPCNDEAHWSVVRDHGYVVCRGTTDRRAATDRIWTRWTERAERWITAPPLATCKSVVPGLVRCTSSLLYNAAGRPWMVPWLLRQGRRGLKRAVSEGGTFHLWTHPFNFAETEGLLSSFRLLLSDAARLRDAGQLQITAFGADLVRCQTA